MFHYKPLKEDEDEEDAFDVAALISRVNNRSTMNLDLEEEEIVAGTSNSGHRDILTNPSRCERSASTSDDDGLLIRGNKFGGGFKLSMKMENNSFRSNVVGPGGILLPKRSELGQLVDVCGRISVMCFTWNIAAQSTKSLHQLNTCFAKMPQKDRPDVIAVSLQELPTSTIKFHGQAVSAVGSALAQTHRAYCWVRKWSQMMIIFVRKRLCRFASTPEYEFVASSRLAKPFRTKGAIGICFRLLQTSCVFISCHLTHGNLKNRILDYHKISRSFDFECLRRGSYHHYSNHVRPNGTRSATNDLVLSTKNGDCTNRSSNHVEPILSQQISSRSPFNNNCCSPSIPIKRAAAIFWFGDLNFRVGKHDGLVDIAARLENKLFRREEDYRLLIENDELNIERNKGFVFEDFKEGIIKFPPTHKFIIGANKYAKNRIPSYTDRVLYWSRIGGTVTPIRYDCIWDVMTSDHKPVYCIFRMCAVDEYVLKKQ